MSKKPSKEKRPEWKSPGFIIFSSVFAIWAISGIMYQNYLFEKDFLNVVYSKAVVENKVYRPKLSSHDHDAGYVLFLKYDYAGKTYKNQIYVRQPDYDKIEIGDSTGIKYNVTHPERIIAELSMMHKLGTRDY